MLFILPLLGALLIGAANGLRNCVDCTHISQCKEAVMQVVADKSEVTSNMLRKAQCGNMKVCCSDFSIQGKMDEGINIEDEIENHPNIHILPKECGKIVGKRIIGGTAVTMNEYPWLALISLKILGKNTFACGGTVINERYVLTAAHCIIRYEIAGVRIGEHVISTKTDCDGHGPLRKCQSNVQDIRVIEAIAHPGYVRYPAVLNDIGLLRLKKPVDFSVANTGTICLPFQRSLRDMDLVGRIGVVAGWGRTENLTESDILLQVEIPIIDENACNSLYKKNKTASKRFRTAFCAGDMGRDSCNGDSGGPLMVAAPYKKHNYRLFQFGIVSYGALRCGSYLPGVYTDVRKFMKWILDTMKP